MTTTLPPPTRRRRSRADQVVRYIGVLGRVFVLAGVLLLFFTAYLLWGTGVYTKHQQARLKGTLANQSVVTEADIADGKIPPARPKTAAKLGDPLFAIKVPKIGLDTVVVEGVGVEELKQGPGLFPDCKGGLTSDCVANAKYPGEKGNVAISAHRTTYGAPFFNVNQLAKGDVIDLVSGPARYRYRVRGSEVVDPVEGFKVVEDHGIAELTLTTCNPRFSAAQRLIIHADYEGASRVSAGSSGSGPAPREVPVVPSDVLILGAIAIASALGALALSKRYQKTAAYITAGMVGGVGLWVLAFPWVVTLMPSNY